MLFDLGLEPEHMDDETMVKMKIEEIENRFDLVMIAEDFQKVDSRIWRGCFKLSRQDRHKSRIWSVHIEVHCFILHFATKRGSQHQNPTAR